MHGLSARRGLAALAAALCGAVLLVVPTLNSQAATGDLGHRGPSFQGATNPPTAEKPQSKLWFHDGSWWAVMYDAGTADWRIKRLDRASNSWISTGVPVDPRAGSLPDVLSSGGKLYVASHWVTTTTDTVTRVSVARSSNLYRYTYDAANQTYTLDAGFPSQIAGMSTEALTIDEDSTGRLWAAWTQVSGSSTVGYTSQVHYASSPDGATWTAPQVVPDAAAAIAPDDIAAVVSFGRGAGTSSIGILWSNQRDGSVYWGVHRDGAGLDDWRTSVAVRGTKRSDDHLSVKTVQSDQQGRVWAATKTSLDSISGAPSSSPMIELLQFKPGTGSWSSTTFGTLADCHTRPIVVLDEENSLVHVFATGPVSAGCAYSGVPGAIYEKVAPMSDPVFPAGRGTPVMRDSASPYLNNVTAAKHPVTSATGLVVLASDFQTKAYWHADLPVGSTPTPTVARRDVSTAVVSTASTAVTVAKPSGTAPGDVLVSCVTLNGGRIPAKGVPAGWTTISAGGAASNPKVYGYYKVAGADEPARYSWSISSPTGGTVGSAGIAGYAGASGLATGVSVASGPIASSGTLPGVTAPTGSMLVGCMGINASPTSITMQQHASMTERWDLGGKRQSYADEVLAVDGPTGSRSWTFSAGRAWSGWLTALVPSR